MAQGATLMTNEGFAGDGSAVPAAYGDNVSAASGNFTVTDGGTPNIQLDFFVLDGFSGPNGYTDGAVGSGSFLTQTNFAGSQGGVLQLAGAVGNRFVLAFTPDDGYAVTIHSFDILEAPGGGNTNFDWHIQPGPTWLNAFGNNHEDFGSTEDVSDLGGRASISGLDFTGEVGQTVYLVIYHGSGDPNSLAIDNVSFGQVPVPEPSGAILAVLGLVGVWVFRRRRI